MAKERRRALFLAMDKLRAVGDMNPEPETQARLNAALQLLAEALDFER